jgi:hypothetical protein
MYGSENTEPNPVDTLSMSQKGYTFDPTCLYYCIVLITDAFSQKCSFIISNYVFITLHYDWVSFTFTQQSLTNF